MNVQNDQVVNLIQRQLKAALTVCGHIHRIAFFFQPFPDEAGYLLFVFHHEKPHGAYKDSIYFRPSRTWSLIRLMWPRPSAFTSQSSSK